MNATALKRLPNLLLLIFGISVFIFLVYKSSTASFTHDESFTYLHYPHDTFMKIISFSDSYSNNHILNSLLMKYSEVLFGNSELALRLPNVLLFAVYLIYGFLIFSRQNRWLAFALFTLLITCVPLVDLFGMARGYGLSMGFMLMSVYHFLAFLRNNGRSHMVLFHVAALLAILASFTLLTVYTAMIGIYILFRITEVQLFTSQKKLSAGKPWLFFIPVLISAVILYEPVRRVIKFNKLDFGGSTGFYSDTMTHLVVTSFDGILPSPAILLLMKILLTMMVGISLFIAIRTAVDGKPEAFRRLTGLTVTGFLLLLLAVIFVAQHYILGTSYPVARFSVFLYPLVILQFGFLSDYLMRCGYRTFVIPIVAGLAFLSALNFANRIDMHAFGEWGYDQNTKKMLRVLAEEKSPESKTISLGVEWLFEPTVNFYRETNHFGWLQPVDRHGLHPDDDYFYISKPVPDSLQPGTWKIIREFESSNSVLLKNIRK